MSLHETNPTRASWPTSLGTIKEKYDAVFIVLRLQTLSRTAPSWKKTEEARCRHPSPTRPSYHLGAFIRFRRGFGVHTISYNVPQKSGVLFRTLPTSSLHHAARAPAPRLGVPAVAVPKGHPEEMLRFKGRFHTQHSEQVVKAAMYHMRESGRSMSSVKV